MEISRQELVEIIQTVVDATIKGLADKGLVGTVVNVGTQSASLESASSRKKRPMQERSAYAQTEALLFNYNNFKKVIRQKEDDIAYIRQYGPWEGGGGVKQYGGNTGGLPRGIVLDEERVEAAVQKIRESMEDTVQAIAMIDNAMKSIKNDPYYRILEMRYFEGCTQEEIAVAFHCTQPNINYHKARLVKELSTIMFPGKVAKEMMS